MATVYMSQSDIDEFEDEADTTPDFLVTVQDQLNAAESVASFNARARADQRGERPHWTERLDSELEGIDVLDMMEGRVG